MPGYANQKASPCGEAFYTEIADLFGDLLAGDLLIELRESGMVELAETVCAQELEHLKYLSGERHGGAEAVAGVKGVGEILGVQVDGEGKEEVL